MKKKPFANFIAEFNRYASRCGKTDEQKVVDLEIRVSQELLDAATHRPNKPGRSAYDSWVKWWQEVYDELQHKQHINSMRKQRGTSFEPNNQSQPKQTATASAAQNDPMELDAIRNGRRLTVEKCRAQGLCLYGKQKGCRVATCPKRIKNNAANGLPPDWRPMRGRSACSGLNAFSPQQFNQ